MTAKIHTRSILITGASTGIGHNAALSLKARGWTVIATARQPDHLQALEAAGIHAVHLELTDAHSVAGTLAATLALTGGTLDALFNNAAYGQTGALEDVATDDLRAQFETNLFGWHELTRQVLPLMRAQGHGRIVQCSSILGFIAAPYRGPYVASKYALEGYSDTLRAEVARFGIKVISIQPGPITSQFRATALATFLRTIDHERSAYSGDYGSQLARLRSPAKTSFELGPQAVTRALIKALESTNPRPVYRVTAPTHLMAWARRILPVRTLNAILSKSA